MDGRTIRLFLVSGKPDEIVTAEILNWTGHVLSAPRNMLGTVRKRDEAAKTGVYFLFGEENSTGIREVYVGETDDVGRRIAEHLKDESKDFFEKFCLFTSKDQNLTKSHVRYLEYRLRQMCQDSGRCILQNKTEATKGSLPESDIADMEFFISQVSIILPILGYDVLRQRISTKDKADLTIKDASGAILDLIYPKNKHGYEAVGYLTSSSLVVRAGSTALKSPKFADSSQAAYADLRHRLIEQNVLIDDENPRLLRFIEDTEFSSPSAAAAVIHGGSRNGRYEWRVKATGQRLKDYEASMAEASA